MDESDNGEVVCVKCVKGRAGSSSAVIHLYFRAEPRSNRHLAGETEKIHCRHHSHSYETTQRKCSAGGGTRFAQRENKENRNEECYLLQYTQYNRQLGIIKAATVLTC